MPNKIYSDVVDYLVEGSKSKGYLKCGSKGYGDGSTSSPVSNYNSKQGVGSNTDSWFEGKKSGKGVSPSVG